MSTRTIPIADAALLGRAALREQRVRVALALAALLLIAAAILLAARAPGPAPAAAGSGGRPVTEVVLDVSGSVGESASDFAGRVLARIGHGGGRVGLVLFSDSAEEALPPGTPATQLLPFARSFTPPKKRGEPLAYRQLSETNPWHPSFSGGTRISAGLATAGAALRRERMHGTALLISDLGDAPSDLRKLREELLRLDRTGTGLKILPLPNAFSIDVKWFRRLAGPEGFAHPLPAAVRPAPVKRGPAAFPLALAGVAVLLALVLAAHELAARPLRWGSAS
jgi:hypothetical protein